MEEFFAICQGAGIAVAIGIGGLIVALLAAALAIADAGWNLEGTDFEFVGEPWFLIVIAVANVAFYLAARHTRDKAFYALAGLTAAALGAVLASASLAEETTTWWPGIAIGFAAAFFAVQVGASVSEGAQRRAGDAGGSIVAFFALGGLALGALSIFVEPIGLVALLALVYLAITRRRRAEAKYEGLRTLR